MHYSALLTLKALFCNNRYLPLPKLQPFNLSMNCNVQAFSLLKDKIVPYQERYVPNDLPALHAIND